MFAGCEEGREVREAEWGAEVERFLKKGILERSLEDWGVVGGVDEGVL